MALRGTRFILALAGTLFLLPALWSAQVSGVVKNQSGEPVVGALVKLKNVDRGVTVTLTTRDGGRYQASNLLPGKHTVQGIGGGLESKAAEITVDASRPATHDIALTEPLNFRLNASMAEYSTLMPEGEAKTIIVSLCTDCHYGGLQEILYSRKSRDQWAATIAKMRKRPYGIVRSLDISDEQVSVVLDYLTAHYGADAPPLDVSKMPKTLYKGVAGKSVVTEFNLPPGADAHDVSIDSKGIGWVAEGGHGVIGRLDPTTLEYRRIHIPGDKPTASAIEVDPQDRIWLSDSSQNRLVLYDPKTEQFTSFSLPRPPGGRANMNTIRFHPDGTVWGTGISSNQIFHVDPRTKKATAYDVPAGVARGSNVNPYGMAIAPDGYIWFAERRSDKVGKVDSKTGEIMEINIPTKGAVLRRMQADKGGNIWFGQFGGVGKLTMIDYKTGKMTEYPTPTKHSGAYSVDVDLTRNVIWVNEMMADQIARFDPRTKTFTEYPIGTKNSSVRRLEVDPSRPNRIWYTGFHVDTVAFIDVAE